LWKNASPRYQPGFFNRLLARRVGVEDALEVAGELFPLSGLAFPDDGWVPARLAEGGHVAFVAGGIGGEFGLPEVVVSGGCGCEGAVVVAVPEAAVDENGEAAWTEGDVGFPGEVAAVEAVAEAYGCEGAAHGEFRGGVRAADAGHVGRPLGRGEAVARGGVGLRRLRFRLFCGCCCHGIA
jgi:hypothetical protein